MDKMILSFLLLSFSTLALGNEFFLRTKMKENMEEESSNGLTAQNFEERTKSFILRAQQRFGILEKKRKRSEQGNVKEDLFLDEEFRIKREVEQEESAFSPPVTTTELSNPLDNLFKRVKDSSGNVVKDLRERWGDAWNKTQQTLKDGVKEVWDSAKQVGENLGNRWDSLKDSTSFRELETRREGDSDEKRGIEEKVPSKGKGLLDRIRGLFSSDR